MIRQAVLDAWIPFNTGKLTWTADDGIEKRSPNEGLVLPSYMYEDILGLVTTGMGNMIEVPAGAWPTQTNPSKSGTITAEGLHAGWTHADGSPATDDEIHVEFAHIKRCWGQGGWEPRGGFTPNGRAVATLWLPEPAAMRLISSKLQAFAADLATQLHGWADYPADGQLALLSHAWACGDSLSAWPKFRGFLNASPTDWRGAAGDGYIYGPSHSVIAGITPRNDANVRLMLNAATVDAQGLDPDVLYFPSSP